MVGRFEYKQKTMAPVKCTHDFFPPVPKTSFAPLIG